jgi:hypothetical protein
MSLAYNSPNRSLSPSALTVQQLIDLPPVTYLQALPSYGVLLCTEHQTCYTSQNLREHLKRKHAVRDKQAKEIKAWIEGQNIAEIPSQPPDYRLFIPGLAHCQGFVCNTVTCAHRVGSREKIERHCSKEHGVASRRQQREGQLYSEVVLQYLFAKNPEYFIVRFPTHAPTLPINPTRRPATDPPLLGNQVSIGSTTLVSSALSLRIHHAAEEQKARYRQIGEPNHVSEITPWLRKSGFHQHLAGIDGRLIVSSCHVPRSSAEDARLYRIVVAVECVFRQAYKLVGRLYHVDARTLNTFQVGTLTQDPFQALQNIQSFINYVKAFQSLVCYFVRSIEDHFGRDMFIVTDEQRGALDHVLKLVEKTHSVEQERAGVDDEKDGGRNGESGQNGP